MTNSSQNTLQDIRHTTVFNAPIEKVWKAVATAEGISTWFMPTINFEPEVGHEFQLNAGSFGISPCRVTKLDPPNLLSFDWAKDWTLTFELKEVEGKTEFTLIHSGWDSNKVTEFGAPHTAVRENMNQGWSAKVMKTLREYVEA